MPVPGWHVRSQKRTEESAVIGVTQVKKFMHDDVILLLKRTL